MLLTTLLLALLPLQEASNASGGELRADQATWDVESYDLSVTVEPESHSIHGSLHMEAVTTAPTNLVTLDLDGRFEVDAAGLYAGCFGDVVLGTAASGRITFPGEMGAGQRFHAFVRYRGKPRVAPNPPWKGGFTWSETTDGSPWIATSCQGEGADLWWPCKDHPSDKPEGMDLRITVPEGLFCASNGVLVSDETKDGWRTQHWRVSEPIANYTVAINIAPYEVIEQEFVSVSGETFPVSYWHLPENAEKARAIFPEFLDHLRHLESVCGPYPFRSQKYGIAETPHLGMEHQTIIAYGNKYRGGPDGFDWLHHHELSHEWWANLVTCRDWKDMWLHEGFATYMQALYAEERGGAAGLEKFMRRTRQLLGNRNPVAPRETMDSQEIYFQDRGRSDSDIYYKGAWVLHTLRWQMGDEAFFELLKRFAYPTEAHLKATDGSQVRFVDTEDFRALAEEIHGESLEWFFELYVRQPHLPKLALTRAGGELELTWRVPAGQTCALDVPLRIDGREVRARMDATGRGRVRAGNDNDVDPAGWLLMD